jgi:hypothetical protein
MADQYQFENSSMSQMEDEPFRSKNFSYVNDMNQGNYASNQVVFDLSSFYNQQKFIAPSEMFLVVPIVSVLSTNAPDGLTRQNGVSSQDFSLGYKSGYYNIISSMQVDYDGKTVQQLTPNLNYYVSFKMNSSMSMSTVDTLGSTLGIYPDSPTAWAYNDAEIDLIGNGVRNNTLGGGGLDVTQVYEGEASNSGALQRRLSTSFNITTQGSSIKAAGNNSQELTNYSVYNPGYEAYYTTMVIRLRDVSDFFAKMPLTKGFYARLTINLNLGSFVISSPAADNNNWVLQGTNINFPNGTCPLMIAPTSETQYPVTITQIIGGIYCRSVTSSLGALNQSTFNIAAHSMTSCRIYAPTIDLQPARALSYIQENRSKYIEWDDIYAAQLLNIGANTPFNYNITNSLPGIKAIVIIPFIASTVNGLMGDRTCTSSFSPCRSPFATEPSTTSPLLSLTNFNVQLAGENVLSTNINYNFEEFIQQLLPANSINGGQGTLGLSSGLIDQLGFQNIYRYYYVDLSRRAKDDVGSKGITILGTNNNLLAIDLYCFVIHKKSASLDVETGKLEMRV